MPPLGWRVIRSGARPPSFIRKPASLAFMAITGPMLYLQFWLRKRKARKKS